MPPRITVLSLPKGFYAIPTRGCTMGAFRVVEEVRVRRDGGVVGNGDATLIAGRSERHVGEHEAVFDAGGVQVLFDAHPVGQLQILGDGPFVGG